MLALLLPLTSPTTLLGARELLAAPAAPPRHLQPHLSRHDARRAVDDLDDPDSPASPLAQDPRQPFPPDTRHLGRRRPHRSAVLERVPRQRGGQCVAFATHLDHGVVDCAQEAPSAQSEHHHQALQAQRDERRAGRPGVGAQVDGRLGEAYVGPPSSAYADAAHDGAHDFARDDPAGGLSAQKASRATAELASSCVLLALLLASALSASY